MSKLKTPMSEKSPEVKASIETIFPGTAAAIAAQKCPMCRSPIDLSSFKDSLSRREFEISGLCQDCQDQVFSHDC